MKCIPPPICVRVQQEWPYNFVSFEHARCLEFVTLIFKEMTSNLL